MEWNELAHAVPGGLPSIPGIPVVTSMAEIEKISKRTDVGFALCGYSPETKEKGLSSVPRIFIKGDKIYHNASTGFGSCMSILVANIDGRTVCLGVHGGTDGAGPNPNWCHTFAPVPLN